MTKISNYITITFVMIFFWGCTPISPSVYYGEHKKPNTVGLLYKQSLTKVSDKYKNQVLTNIIKLEDKNENLIELDQRTDLKPGNYTVYIDWKNILEEDASAFIQVLAFAVDPYAIRATVIKSEEPYEINFIVKEGMTYLVEVESTLKFKQNPPKKLCIIEEKHNAIGAESPTLNPTIRYPSSNAKIVACSK